MTSDYRHLRKAIELRTNPLWREWEKVPLLEANRGYIRFLSTVCQQPASAVQRALREFRDDDQFRRTWAPRLQEFEADDSLVHGDVRFHSLTLYSVVRLLHPHVALETGVASGKSSAVVLL